METINEILKIVPEKYQKPIILGVILVAASGRVYNTISKGGGVLHIWRSLIFGVNYEAPKVEETKTTTETK